MTSRARSAAQQEHLADGSPYPARCEPSIPVGFAEDALAYANPRLGRRQARRSKTRAPGGPDADRTAIVFGEEMREEEVINVAKPHTDALLGRKDFP